MSNENEITTEYVLTGFRLSNKKNFRYTCGSVAVAEAYAEKHKDDIKFDKLLKVSSEVVRDYN